MARKLGRVRKHTESDTCNNILRYLRKDQKAWAMPSFAYSIQRLCESESRSLCRAASTQSCILVWSYLLH